MFYIGKFSRMGSLIGYILGFVLSLALHLQFAIYFICKKIEVVLWTLRKNCMGVFCLNNQLF